MAGVGRGWLSTQYQPEPAPVSPTNRPLLDRRRLHFPVQTIPRGYPHTCVALSHDIDRTWYFSGGEYR